MQARPASGAPGVLLMAEDLPHPAKKVCQMDSRRDMAAHESGRVSEIRESKTHDQALSAPERRQSASLEPSSLLFDSSGIDTSKVTAITEPDVVGVTAAVAAGTIQRPLRTTTSGAKRSDLDGTSTLPDLVDWKEAGSN
ncbi:hypothetical protein CONLIGDRAFT_107831 [Coniochaeta ligniaria NRRL 30616]|uniref:Uncharacterized protein n=1 Tax=Coniochaeta ligniaria NRRL 30616 TaxID=1408157 RepID=A0A1J7I9U5_9PEZI|nr:hypothetical protein CONLIGDRAFT_107831 [Coniochaeta ligniaria NRRL 30616]